MFDGDVRVCLWNVGVWESYSSVIASEEIVQKEKEAIISKIDHDVICLQDANEKIVKCFPKASTLVHMRVGTNLWVWDRKRFELINAKTSSDLENSKILFKEIKTERIVAVASMIFSYATSPQQDFDLQLDRFRNEGTKWLDIHRDIKEKEDQTINFWAQREIVKDYLGSHQGRIEFHFKDFMRKFLVERSFNDFVLNAENITSGLSPEEAKKRIVEIRDKNLHQILFVTLDFFHVQHLFDQRFCSAIFPREITFHPPEFYVTRTKRMISSGKMFEEKQLGTDSSIAKVLRDAISPLELTSMLV